MCNRLRTTIQRARNRRVCDWCGQTIEAAERYVCATYLDEGGWRNTSMHPECDEDMCIVAAEEGGCIVLARDNERPVVREALEEKGLLP